jgi:hypothetical protein
LTREVERKGVGLTTDRFAAKEGSEVALARGLNGAGRHRPLEHSLRQMVGAGWLIHRSGVSSTC